MKYPNNGQRERANSKGPTKFQNILHISFLKPENQEPFLLVIFLLRHNYPSSKVAFPLLPKQQTWKLPSDWLRAFFSRIKSHRQLRRWWGSYIYEKIPVGSLRSRCPASFLINSSLIHRRRALGRRRRPRNVNRPRLIPDINLFLLWIGSGVIKCLCKCGVADATDDT